MSRCLPIQAALEKRFWLMKLSQVCCPLLLLHCAVPCYAVLAVQVLDRNVENLSGGELQRFAIAVVAAQKADVYMIDEPSSYLDVRQRLKAAKVRD